MTEKSVAKNHPHRGRGTQQLGADAVVSVSRNARWFSATMVLSVGTDDTIRDRLSAKSRQSPTRLLRYRDVHAWGAVGTVELQIEQRAHSSARWHS
jgi:hypothetical protein